MTHYLRHFPGLNHSEKYECLYKVEVINFRLLVRMCGYSIATRSYSKQIRVPEHKVEPMSFQLLARMCLLDGDSIGDTLKNPCARKIFSPVSR